MHLYKMFYSLLHSRSVVEHDTRITINMCRYSYNRRSSKFFQKLNLMLVVKICSKCADKHKQNVELICRRHIEQSIILILIHRSQLIGIDPIYISAWKNNEVGVALLCAYHCALCNRIVKIIFKVAHQKSYFYTSAFSSIIHHLMILRTNQPCCFRRSKAASHKARLWALPYLFILISFLQSTTESVPFGLPSHQPSPVRNITSN